MQILHMFFSGLTLILLAMHPSIARQTGTETQTSADVGKKPAQVQNTREIPPPPPPPPMAPAGLSQKQAGPVLKPTVAPPPPPPPPPPVKTSVALKPGLVPPPPPPPPPAMAGAPQAKAGQGVQDKPKPSPVISGGIVLGRDAQGRRTIAVEKAPPPKDARASGVPTADPNDRTYRFALHPTEQGHSFTLEKEKGGTVTQQTYDINWKNILKKPQTPEEKAAQKETKSNLKELGKSLLGIFGF